MSFQFTPGGCGCVKCGDTYGPQKINWCSLAEHDQQLPNMRGSHLYDNRAVALLLSPDSLMPSTAVVIGGGNQYTLGGGVVGNSYYPVSGDILLGTGESGYSQKKLVKVEDRFYDFKNDDSPSDEMFAEDYSDSIQNLSSYQDLTPFLASSANCGGITDPSSFISMKNNDAVVFQNIIDAVNFETTTSESEIKLYYSFYNENSYISGEFDPDNPCLDLDSDWIIYVGSPGRTDYAEYRPSFWTVETIKFSVTSTPSVRSNVSFSPILSDSRQYALIQTFFYYDDLSSFFNGLLPDSIDLSSIDGYSVYANYQRNVLASSGISSSNPISGNVSVESVSSGKTINLTDFTSPISGGTSTGEINVRKNFTPTSIPGRAANQEVKAFYELRKAKFQEAKAKIQEIMPSSWTLPSSLRYFTAKRDASGNLTVVPMSAVQRTNSSGNTSWTGFAYGLGIVMRLYDL